MNIEQNAQNTLISLGFSDKEAKVYIALLQLGQGSVSHIAKQAHTQRTIVYPIVEKLHTDGYVTEVLGKATKTYQINDPSLLISKMKTASNNLDFVLHYLQDTASKATPKPKVAIYDTKEAILRLYKHINMQIGVLSLTSYERQEDIFKEAFPQWEADIQAGVYKMKDWKFLIGNDSGVRTAKLLHKNGHNVRIVQFPKNETADMSIFGNTIAIAVFEKKPFTVTIESQYLADSFRMMYKMLWENGRELKL